MAKKKQVRKKHVNPIEQRRLQEIQYRKFFDDKLRELCRQIGDVSLFSLIPPTERLITYRFRGASLKVVAAPDAKIPIKLRDALAKLIKSQQLVMTLEVVKGSNERMTFADYAIVGTALEYQLRDSDGENYPGKERFNKFLELKDERGRLYEDGLLKIGSTACWFFDELDNKFLYTYKYDVHVPALESGVKPPKIGETSFRQALHFFETQDFRLHPVITIGTYPLEWRKITMNGETHTATPVGFLHYINDEPHFVPFAISPEDLKIRTHFTKLKLPVYIQQHAVERMKERIGCPFSCFYRTILAESIMGKKEFIPLSKNRLLIGCFTNDLKLGYFVAENVEGIVLIRTFLLLTNSGTPEGDKLARLTGLEIEDRKYLAIDTLQGLANSDIERNEPICKLFRAAGCGSILELCKKINNEPHMMWLLDQSQPKNLIADLMTEYMKPGDE
ncbi:MAG: hypothetical protein LBF19_00555 [Prevotellaceae bacterium]|jgi:hypothetical protein|nr:hypothetical protein [Prevotellaceae bacterium]